MGEQIRAIEIQVISPCNSLPFAVVWLWSLAFNLIRTSCSFILSEKLKHETRERWGKVGQAGTGRTASLEALVLGFRHFSKRLSSLVPMYIQGK